MNARANRGLGKQGMSIHTGTLPSKTLRQAVLEHLAQRPLDVLDPTRLEESDRQAVRGRACQSGRRDELRECRRAGLEGAQHDGGLVEYADATSVVHVLILASHLMRRNL